MEINRFDVILINLDPAIGHEIKKKRPCLVISPNEMNHHISTVIVVPMATKGRNYPTRIGCTFHGKNGQIILDQIRTVDKRRVVRKLGTISRKTQGKTARLLQELFAL